LRIEGGEARAQPPRGLALVVVGHAEHALDVPPFVVARGAKESLPVDVAITLDEQTGREVVGGEEAVLGQDDGPSRDGVTGL
jgi:hypothetical protein